MIALELRNQFSPEEWVDVVNNCGGGPLQYPNVHLLARDSGRPCFLVARREGRVVGCCLGLTRSRRILGCAVGPRTLYLPTAPSLAGGEDDARRQMRSELPEFARKNGFTMLEIAHTSGDDFTDDRQFAPWIVDRLVDFTIDLTQSTDDLLAAMHKYHRKNVRRSQRNDIELVEDSSLEGLLRLRDLQCESATRGQAKGNTFRIADETMFRSLYERVYSTGLGKVLFAKVQGEFVAGLAYLSNGRRAVTVRSGANRNGNEHLAMYFLQSELMWQLKELGVVELNIGAVPLEAREEGHAQHGLYEFKLGFGGVERVRTSVRVDLRRVTSGV